MIDRRHRLSIRRQSQLVGISRGTVYYTPVAVSTSDLALMRRLDELHLEYPFAGSRMLSELLQREGFPVGRKRVATRMKRMGIQALYRKPNTSQAAVGHKIYPYLLRDLTIDRPNQVWAMDITYVPLARGFLYLCAVLDWASRKILAHGVSNCIDPRFCLETLQEAFDCHGQPEILNTDQGSQFTPRWCVFDIQLIPSP